MQIEGLVISRRDEAQRLPRRSEINTFREREGQEEEARVIKQLNSGRRSGKKRGGRSSACVFTASSADRANETESSKRGLASNRVESKRRDIVGETDRLKFHAES